MKIIKWYANHSSANFVLYLITLLGSYFMITDWDFLTKFIGWIIMAISTITFIAIEHMICVFIANQTIDS